LKAVRSAVSQARAGVAVALPSLLSRPATQDGKPLPNVDAKNATHDPSECSTRAETDQYGR